MASAKSWRAKDWKYKNVKATVQSLKTITGLSVIKQKVRTSVSYLPIQANTQYIAFLTGDEELGILPLDSQQNWRNNMFPVSPNQESNSDVGFSPHYQSILATTSADCYINIWKIEQKSCAQQQRIGLQEKGDFLQWNPFVENLMSVVCNERLLLFDVNVGDPLLVDNEISHGDTILGACWSLDGLLLATTCKDKMVRVFDPRESGTPAQTCPSHADNMSESRILFINEGCFVTTGHDNKKKSELQVYDRRNMTGAVTTMQFGENKGTLLPLYDQDTNMLFLANKKGGAVWFVQCFSQGFQVYEDKVNDIRQPTRKALKGACLIPKRAVDVKAGEVNRMLLLDSTSVVPISYTLPTPPRMSQPVFRKDAFPDTYSGTPGCYIPKWIDGGTPDIHRVSLDPNPVKSDMRPRRNSMDRQTKRKGPEKRHETFTPASRSELQDFLQSGAVARHGITAQPNILGVQDNKDSESKPNIQDSADATAAQTGQSDASVDDVSPSNADTRANEKSTQTEVPQTDSGETRNTRKETTQEAITQTESAQRKTQVIATQTEPTQVEMTHTATTQTETTQKKVIEAASASTQTETTVAEECSTQTETDSLHNSPDPGSTASTSPTTEFSHTHVTELMQQLDAKNKQFLEENFKRLEGHILKVHNQSSSSQVPTHPTTTELKQMTELRENYDRLEESHKRLEGEKAKEVDQKGKELSKLADTNQELKRKCEELESQKSRITQELEESSNRCEKMREDGEETKKALMGKIDELTNECTEKENKKIQLEQELDQKTGELNRLTDTKKELERKCEEMESEKANMAQEVDRSSRELNELTETNKQLVRKCEETQSETSNIAQELDESRKHCEKIKEDFEQTKTDLMRKMDELANECTEQKNKKIEIEQDLEKIIQNNEGLDKKCQQQDSKIKWYESKLNGKTSENEELQKRCTRLETERLSGGGAISAAKEPDQETAESQSFSDKLKRENILEEEGESTLTPEGAAKKEEQIRAEPSASSGGKTKGDGHNSELEEMKRQMEEMRKMMAELMKTNK